MINWVVVVLIRFSHSVHPVQGDKPSQQPSGLLLLKTNYLCKIWEHMLQVNSTLCPFGDWCSDSREFRVSASDASEGLFWGVGPNIIDKVVLILWGGNLT